MPGRNQMATASGPADTADDRIWSNIDIPKTIAGTLAAVSAAVVGSFLGVAGTLIGAAVASLVSSIGTEVYHRYLNRGTRRLRSALVTTPMAAPAAVGTPDVAAASEPPSGPAPRRLRLKRAALVAGALFVLAMGTLTAIELMAGKAVGDVTRGGDNGSPTLLRLSGDNDPAPRPGGDRTSAPAGEEPGADPAESGRPAQSGQPGTATPQTQDPGTQAPPTQVPQTRQPDTQAPATRQPDTQAPEPTGPADEEPAEPAEPDGGQPAAESTADTGEAGD